MASVRGHYSPASRVTHNIDFELIEDAKRRAVCEARSLQVAPAMMIGASSQPDFD